MTATPIKETPVQAQKRFMVAIKAAMANIRHWETQVGLLLTEAKAFFKDDAVFFLWAEKATGRKQAMIYRYMQAAEVATQCPEAAEVTRSVESLAALARVPAEDRKAVVAEAKKVARVAGDSSVTGEHFRVAAATVIPAEAAKAADKAETEKVEGDRLQGQDERKILPKMRQAVPALVLSVVGDAILSAEVLAIVEEAVIVGLVRGSTWGALHGALAGKAATVCAANYRAERAEAAEVAANPLHNATEAELAEGAEAEAEAAAIAEAEALTKAERQAVLAARREKATEVRAERQAATAEAEAALQAEKKKTEKAAKAAK